MLGWKIFAHSVRMVFGNLKQVLHITVGPAAIATAVIVVLFVVLDIPLEALDDSADQLPFGTSVGSIFAFVLTLIVVMLITMFWIAVSWHRFILLEEYPSGIVPTFRFDRILAYLGRLLLLGLLFAIAWLPMGLLISALVSVGGGEVVSVVVTVVYSMFLIVCFYRLSIILPAAAIGHPVTIGEAWASTVGVSGAVFVLLVVAFLFQIAIQLIFTALAFIPVLGVLLTVFFGTLILPLINVSILTTMYGIFIEKRELT
ncbi:hypothetical protein HW561_09100 [Rhodobacteraceae bacterium B1Z28]|uniref:Glycerophosphoryl diester phosphodiesterase membrane domain-containing protein n=1 Tax=Ruegeria haliotis TaxID=2747601 RepID=A0ABX2PP76_9RHOB|nr:hypothetical protein [Ruegeria haliotis]NVO55944.1 hypothetical protein [Ruegeria haliotis]